MSQKKSIAAKNQIKVLKNTAESWENGDRLS